MIRRLALENGVRVVIERLTAVRSVSLGIWLGVGSRHESASEHGLSHFIEHMFFKGTRRRTARQIAQEVDLLGGEMNAFTTRETTAFYVKVPNAGLPRAVDLLSDVFHHSLFEEREIAREKQVVIEEIKMAEDDPESHVHDLHLQSLWPDDALGRTVQGTAPTVSRLTRRDLLAFIARHYSPENVVIAAAGHLEPDTVHRLMDRAFRRLPRSSPPRHHVPRPVMRHGLFQTRRRLGQVHLCLSLPGLSSTHPDRYVLMVLSALLGGGPSSRLFQEVRESRGLAYSIYSSLSSFTDVGLLSVYAATSVSAAAQVLRLTLREIGRLKTRPVSIAELNRVKRQMTGSLMLGLESTSARMSKLAREELYFGRGFTLEEILRGITAVSRPHLQRVANDLFDERSLAVSALGPVSGLTLRPRALAVA